MRYQEEGFGGGGVCERQGVSKKKSKGTRASLPDRCQPEKEGVRPSATMKLLQEATNNKKVKHFDFLFIHMGKCSHFDKDSNEDLVICFNQIGI